MNPQHSTEAVLRSNHNKAHPPAIGRYQVLIMGRHIPPFADEGTQQSALPWPRSTITLEAVLLAKQAVKLIDPFPKNRNGVGARARRKCNGTSHLGHWQLARHLRNPVGRFTYSAQAPKKCREMAIRNSCAPIQVHTGRSHMNRLL